MKTFQILIIVIIAALPSASARLEDTIEICQQRYGEPFKTEGKFTYFRKSGFFIMVTFFEAKVDSITYAKLEQNALGKPADLSANEIQQLLTINGGTRTWKKSETPSMDREWRTEDGDLFAFYKTFENYLGITTKGFTDRASAEKNAEENKPLEGF